MLDSTFVKFETLDTAKCKYSCYGSNDSKFIERQKEIKKRNQRKVDMIKHVLN